ncbi:MAG: hypothetical protein HC869_25225 [Rhodospirillales bacterium]|nr:hypothetical protein [Rhodospirillales bacterium]
MVEGSASRCVSMVSKSGNRIMTKPLTVDIADDMADALAKAANDLGETEEQFVQQALAQRLKALRITRSSRAAARVSIGRPSATGF